MNERMYIVGADDARAPEWRGRAVGLLDLDAFFASVEQLDHPEWRGKPVIVGGDSSKRGVVSTASYEARRFGVHSAMASAEAARLCPDAIWTHGNFARYAEVSASVMDIIIAETPYVEQVSIDEAFFDITPGSYAREDPIEICRRIQARVADLGVTCSIGLGTSKTIGKIASEFRKPNGITAVRPGHERAFLAPLPVKAMSGLGRKTCERLNAYGIHTLGQLAEADPYLVGDLLGSNAAMMRSRAVGVDTSRVRAYDESDDPKSVSNERTFECDLTTRPEVLSSIAYIATMTARRLRRKGLRGRVVSLKLHFDFATHASAQEILPRATDDEKAIRAAAERLLGRIWQEGRPIRLLGIAVRDFGDAPEQLTLFDDVERIEAEEERSRDLARSADAVRKRFGDGALMNGAELRFKSRVSNTAPQSKEEY